MNNWTEFNPIYHPYRTFLPRKTLSFHVKTIFPGEGEFEYQKCPRATFLTDFRLQNGKFNWLKEAFF